MNKITQEFVKNFVFTINSFCDKGMVQKTYKNLMEKYNTDIDGLDDTYFKYENKTISNFTLQELIFLVQEIKKLLKKHSLKYNINYYSLYYDSLNGLIGNLLHGEYGKLSEEFKKSKKIKDFFINE